MPNYAKTTVMVIEDDPHYLNQMLRILEEQGFAKKNVTTAMSFGEAATKAEAMKAPDLIITDYKMPGGDGIDVLQMLNHVWREKPAGCDFHPAIMVTSDPNGFLTREVQRGGATGAQALEAGILRRVVGKAETRADEGVIKAEIRTALLTPTITPRRRQNARRR